MNDFFEALNKQLEAEANEKVKKAMQLFIQCDSDMKVVVLHASGYRGVLDAVKLREHFDTLELLDLLDDLIEDMEFDIEHNS